MLTRLLSAAPAPSEIFFFPFGNDSLVSKATDKSSLVKPILHTAWLDLEPEIQ